MVLRVSHRPRSNFFNDFDYAKWVDKTFLIITPSPRFSADIREYEKLLTDFEDIGAIEASFAICWQQVNSGFFDAEEYPNRQKAAIESVKELFDPSVISDAESKMEEKIREYEISYSDSRSSCTELLPALVEQHKPNVPPDGYVLDKDAIVYVHLAVGHALMLERIEKARSERFGELLEDALRIIKTPKSEALKPWYEERPYIQVPIENSMVLIEILIVSILFHKHFLQNDYEEALECLNRAAVLCTDIWEENSEANEQEGLEISEWMSKLHSDYPAIETLDVGAHLVRLCGQLRSMLS